MKLRPSSPTHALRKIVPPRPVPTRPTLASSDVPRGVIFMVLSVFCFAGHTLLLKHLTTTRSLDVSVALLFRALVGGAIVIFFFNPSRRPLRLRPVFTEKRLIWRGLLGIVGTAAFYWSIPRLGAGKATLFSNTYVLFGALFAAIFLGEHLSRRKVTWLLVAFVGITLLSAGPNGDGAGGGAFGFGLPEAIALLGAVTAATTVVLIRQLTATHSNGTIFFCQCAWIALAALPFAISRYAWTGWEDFSLLTATAVLAGYGQLAMNQGYRLLSVASGASIQMGLPVVAAIGGYFLFGEIFTALQLAGAALVLTGTYFVATRK